MAKKTIRPVPSASSSEDEDASASSDDDKRSDPAASAAAPSSSSDDASSHDEDEQQTDAKPDDAAKGDSESEEEESEAEDEKTEDIIKKGEPLISSPHKPASESSADESESDSESEKAAASEPRAAAKESNKSNGKFLFERIWSFEDEIKLLEGLAKYESIHGPIKFPAIGEFYAFIQKSLSFPCSATQVLDKIRRLKKRHSRLSLLAKKGTELKLKPHDLNVLELGKRVWGEGEEAVDECGTGRKSLKREREFPFLMERVFSMGNKYFREKQMNKLIGMKKAKNLEKRLKKQKAIEMDLQLHKMILLKKSMQLVAEGVHRAMEAMEEE